MPVHHGCRFFAGLIFTRRVCLRADGKNFKLFLALQTLNENGVEVENQPSRPV